MTTCIVCQNPKAKGMHGMATGANENQYRCGKCWKESDMYKRMKKEGNLKHAISE